MNTRRLQRNTVSGTTVELFDGRSTIAGVVKNVSRMGIETWLDADAIDPSAAKLLLRLSYDGETYRIGTIPRWQKADVGGSRVG